MSLEGRGKFEIDMTPQSEQKESDGGVQRFSFQKKYKGDLQGVSKGEMLSHMTNVEGSAGYVAIEHFTGKVQDKRGSFFLQHYGLMDSGEDRLIVEIIPDSGNGELKGLWGTLAIEVYDGVHKYDFEFNQDGE
jgi:hypothetical protein